MALTEQEEKSFLTQRVILVGLAILAVGGLLLGAFFAGGSRTGFGLLFSRTPVLGTPANAAAGLDTPVVLIGGSVMFKAGSQKGTLSWTPVPASCTSKCTEYFLDPGYPVSTIALKDSSDDDGTDASVGADNNPAKDKIRADISNAGSNWEIDEYATISKTETQVASITPNATEIHVKVVAPAALCLKTSKRLVFSPTGVCPAPDGVTFTKVALQIDNAVVSGTLSCFDDSSTPTLGKCRIVFRGSN
jgi:hypothetical protein